MSSYAGGAVTSELAAVDTPNGNPYRQRLRVTTAKGSLAAGDYLVLWQYVEGMRAFQLRFGTAQAKQSVLSFGCKAPAGTYTVVMQSADAPTIRSYLQNFTISAGQANTDTQQTLSSPVMSPGHGPA